MRFVYLVLAIAVLGVGSMLLPPIKEVTAAIFEAFDMDTIGTPLVKVIVSLWPVILLAAIAFGAIMLFKGRST